VRGRLTCRRDALAAAGGLSNREIAGNLTVSVRTVEGHLSRIYNKLGVNDRAGLAAVLGPR
jgi:DNA-binding NarL/FixJ family response regulator